jgi:Uma2 family endonuclease
MSIATKRIGPSDHGKRMRLADFEHAEVEPGYIYELGRGVIVVSDVPSQDHFAIVDALRGLLYVYKSRHPEVIQHIAAGSDCKLLTQDFESERHPDIAVYKTAAPDPEEDDDPWRLWVPELVIEVVSPRSGQRDYEEKPEEYLAIGVHEYWIIDARKQSMLALRRRAGVWEEQHVKASETYRTPLLPGFKLELKGVLRVGKGKGRREKDT